MGLDQSFYKRQSEYTTLTSEREQLRKSASDILESIASTEQFTTTLTELLQAFNSTNSDEMQELLQSKFTHPVVQFLDALTESNLITSIDVNSRDYFLAQFMSLTDWIEPNPELVEIRNRLIQISEQLPELQTEVAYYRKYHDLNDFILDRFGGDNCEHTELDLADLEEISDWIDEDIEEKRESDAEWIEENFVAPIIMEFDESCTYTYEPWW